MDNQFINQLPTIEEDGTVVILATGGTIAGVGEKGKETAYSSGELTVDQLFDVIPELKKVAKIKTIQICNINSDDMSAKIWINITNTINQLARNKKVAGFVITHGTDTMEETAYFLNLVIKTKKPVVLTGAMRPQTAISPDGPMNLYQSVFVAASKKSYGKGVLVVFSDNVMSARAVEKVSTYNVMAISAGEMGCVGIVRNNEVEYYTEPSKLHTTKSQFSIEGLTDLPKVSIVYFAVDADPNILKYAADNSDGIVIAGAGAGEYSKKFADIINNLKIPVVVSSRIDDGIITQDAVLCKNTIAANNLTPQKAAILLRLALANKKSSHDELIKIYAQY